MITLDNGEEIRTLESFRLKELSDHDNPSGWNFDHKLQYIPGRDSPWDFGTERKGSEFEIPCKSFNQDESITQKQINEFNSFAFNMYREPRDIKMWFDYEPDKFIMVQLKQAFGVGRATKLKSLSIPFISLDGKKYALSNQFDPETIPEYDQVVEGDRYANSKSLDLVFRRNYTGFHNYSSFLTHVIFKISGTIKNASITHQQSNIELTLPNMTNGIMLIDTKDASISINGHSLLEGSNYNFFSILPGNNGFLFKSENPKAKVTFEWLHEF